MLPTTISEETIEGLMRDLGLVPSSKNKDIIDLCNTRGLALRSLETENEDLRQKVAKLLAGGLGEKLTNLEQRNSALQMQYLDVMEKLGNAQEDLRKQKADYAHLFAGREHTEELLRLERKNHEATSTRLEAYQLEMISERTTHRNTLDSLEDTRKKLAHVVEFAGKIKEMIK